MRNPSGTDSESGQVSDNEEEYDIGLKIITDEEIMNQVNAIWEHNELKKEDSLTMDLAVPYIQEYCKKYLNIDFATADDETIQKIFDDIDTDRNGTIERDELFNHLKKTTSPDAY